MIPKPRTGSALALLLIVSQAAWAAGEPSITMQVDRDKVGTEDTFRAEIVISNASNANLNFPVDNDFEVLGKSQSTQMSYSVGPGGAGVVTQVQRVTLTMRANRPGRYTLPLASLKLSSGEVLTAPSVSIQVFAGRMAPERPPRRPQAQNPFGLPPGFPGLPGFDDDEPDQPQQQDPGFEEPDVPRSDSDLFIRASLDKNEAYVGEQLVLSFHLYSRVDLSSVDSVSLPKLDGFLSQDFPTPNQLISEQRVIGGVPYREYLVRRKALFPIRAGDVRIEPVEADITTGVFYAGRRVHRKGNELKLTVRNLPPGPATSIVGKWRLSREVSQTEVALGEPIQVKFEIEGRGSLQNLSLPPLEVPKGFNSFGPETKDKPTVTRTWVGGSRTIEYTLVPQQTGTFTLPALRVPFFDPETRKFEEMRVDAITLTARPGVGGAKAGPQNGTIDPGGPKNQLVAGGLKSLRHTAHFTGERQTISSQRWFWPVAAAPLLLTLLAGGALFIRSSLGPESAQSLTNKQARAAQKRLAAAQKLLTTGSTTEFYAEVERALTAFMSARLDTNVAGFTREQLVERLSAAGIAEEERARIVAVLETCDLGRYAPGMGDAFARKRAIDDAAKAMEGWS